GSLRRGQLTLDEVMLLANDTTVTAQGKIGGLSEGPSGKMTYMVVTKNITPWLALADQKGAGGIDLHGTASGAFTALSLEGKATLSNFQVDTSSVQSGTVTYALTAVGSPQPRGQITAALNGIDAAGTPLRTVKADLALTGMEPAEVQAELVVQDDALRTHKLKAQGQYQPERVQARIQELIVQLPTGAWRTPQSAQLVMQGDTLTINDFQLQREKQVVSVQGVVSLQGGQTQDLRVQVNRLAVAELRALVEDSPDVSGQITAEVRLQGTAAAPIIEATLNTDGLAVSGQTYADLTARGTYRQDRFDLNLLLRQDATHTLTVEGGVPVSLGWAGEGAPTTLGEANLRARSEGLNLAVLGLLSKEVRDVQGTLSMDVRVRGPVDALAPSGQIRVSQGQAQVIPLGLRLTDLDLQVGLTPDAVQITQLSARAGDGRLTGSGKLALQQYTITTLALTLNADRFRVIKTREYEAAVSGQIVGSGSLQYPFIRGALTVEDARLRPDLALLQSGPSPPDPTIIVVEHAQAPTAPGQPAQPTPEQTDSRFAPPQPDLAPQLSLDMAVTVPRGTWVHLDDGSIELMGEVRIQKGPQEDMVLAGAVETVRGWYVFQGRKFRLERGRVVFTGGIPIDPGLDVVALYTLPDYRVYVAIGGTASTPTLTLRSEPTLEQADILSVLAFGRPVEQLTGGEKASLQSRAVQATVGYVAADLRRSVADKLGVENLEVDVGSSLAESSIGVGKQVSRNIFVSTSQKLGNKQEREVAIEYHLIPGWQLKTSSTSKGHHGVDLFWEKRY
ncbi:MAG: translocation/assembly module TamB domain-containing protein, partial [Candidatus Binatia bacterium]